MKSERDGTPTFLLGIFFSFLLVALSFLSILSVRLWAQNVSDSSGEFKRLAQELSTNRLDGSAENESQQEKALGAFWTPLPFQF